MPSRRAQLATAGVGMAPQWTGAQPRSATAAAQAARMRGVLGRRSPASATRSPWRISPRVARWLEEGGRIGVADPVGHGRREATRPAGAEAHPAARHQLGDRHRTSHFDPPRGSVRAILRGPAAAGVAKYREDRDMSRDRRRMCRPRRPGTILHAGETEAWRVRRGWLETCITVPASCSRRSRAGSRKSSAVRWFALAPGNGGVLFWIAFISGLPGRRGP